MVASIDSCNQPAFRGATGYNLASYYAAMSVQPDDTRKGYMQSFADELNAESGLMGQIRGLYQTAAHDIQTTRINMLHPSEVATIVNGVGTGMTYVEDTYLKGDAVGAYMDTGIADNNAAPWSQDSAFVYLYVSLEPLLNGALVGTIGAASTRIVGGTSAAISGRIHGAGAAVATTTNSFSSVLVNRTGANTIEIDRNGALEATNAASASVATVAGNICLFRNNTAYGDAAVAMLVFGGKLTQSQKNALDTAAVNYLSNIGAV